MSYIVTHFFWARAKAILCVGPKFVLERVACRGLYKADMLDFHEVLSLLPVTENAKQSSVGKVPYILHEDHRWVLPLVHFAQKNGLLPKPCTVVMFDRHTDAVDPPKAAADHLKQLRRVPTLTGIISLCAERLKKNDDDWLKVGMELGLFGDAVIFGVDGSHTYADHSGDSHRIEASSLLPRHVLDDAFRFDEFALMWKLLGWKAAYNGGRFSGRRPKILLTIDLDCFAVEHGGGYTFAWPNKIFEGEFSERTKTGWTGRDYLQGLTKKAGLVAIARETGCCGGSEDALAILQNLIRYGFGDRLSF